MSKLCKLVLIVIYLLDSLTYCINDGCTFLTDLEECERLRVPARVGFYNLRYLSGRENPFNKANLQIGA